MANKKSYTVPQAAKISGLTTSRVYQFYKNFVKGTDEDNKKKNPDEQVFLSAASLELLLNRRRKKTVQKEQAKLVKKILNASKKRNR